MRVQKHHFLAKIQYIFWLDSSPIWRVNVYCPTPLGHDQSSICIVRRHWPSGSTVKKLDLSCHFLQKMEQWNAVFSVESGSVECWISAVFRHCDVPKNLSWGAQQHRQTSKSWSKNNICCIKKYPEVYVKRQLENETVRDGISQPATE